MFRKGLLLILCLWANSTAQASDITVSRIFCFNRVSFGQGLTTLRSDSSPRYSAIDLEFKDIHGHAIEKVENPLPLISNNFAAELFFVGVNKITGQRSLYYSTADYPMRQGTAEALAPLPAFETRALDGWEMKMNPAALSGKNLAFARTATSFEVFNFEQRKTVKTWKVNGLAMNPVFSAQGEWVKADILMKDGQSLTQIFSLNTDEVLKLPTSKNQQVAFHFINDESLVWTEGSIYEVGAKKTMTLKGMSLSDLRKNKSAQTLATRSAPLLRPYLVFSRGPVEHYAVSVIEEFPKSSSVSAPLEKAELQRISITKDLQTSVAAIIPYNEDLLQKSLSLHNIRGSLLSSGVYSPSSDQMIFSLGLLGGLASYSLKNQQWNFHASSDIYKCFYPVVGPEVTNE